MKFFLITCIVAMISAGVYGTIDLAKDIRLGTLIQYEKEDGPVVTSLAQKNKSISQLVNIHTVKTETEKEEKTSNPTIQLSDLKMEYFSRGEPPDFAMLELMEVDSAKQMADSLLVSTESVSEIKTDPVIEERKLSPQLFSRSRPRPYVKKEEVKIVQIDSLKE